MTIYVDTSPPGACIAFEEGTSLCGGHDCHKSLDTFEDSIWDVILMEKGIFHDCDCRDHLRAELGFDSDEEMEAAARSFRARQRLREKRREVRP